MVTLGDLAQAIDERTRNITDLVTITSSHPVAHGGYGAIWRGEYQGKTVAVKIPRQGEVPLEKFVVAQIRELGSWAMTDHPNVLPLLGYCAEFDKSLRMVSPWMSNGTVLDFVQKHEDADPMKLIEGMARGLEYLHELNIVHGDLRCSNILISDEKEPVISDFGLSRHTLEMPASSSSHGSHRWRAPELHLPEKFGLTVEGAHAPPADIWSFGMTILVCRYGEPPYHELETNSIVFNAITSGKIPKRPWQSLSPPSDPLPLDKPLDFLWPFCLQCWVHFPSSRPTMKDSVQSLRKLSRNDTNSKLQLIMERVEDECHKLRGNIVKTSFHGKAKYLYHIIVTMVVVTTILAWRVLSNGTWQAGILYPLLAGSVTWLALQYDFSDHDRISSTTMEVSWEVVKLCARLIYVIVLGFMCLDFLVGQLGQDITFPRLFPLRFGMSTTQKKI